MHFVERALPIETVDGLRPPLTGFPYFAHADRFCFDPAASGESAVNAWWLSDACFLVYGDAAFIERVFEASPLPMLGFQLEWLGTRDDNRGMVLSREDALILVFRGTRLQVQTVLDVAEVVLINQSDLWTDSRFFPAACAAGGRVHSGFLRAFVEISSKLDVLIQHKRPQQKLWLTGHSLGGALATLAAAHAERMTVQGLYTFGSPRVGNAEFARALPQQSHVRYVHRDDWVPTVPPEFLGYVHAGILQAVPESPPRQFWSDLASGAGELAAVLKVTSNEMRLTVGDMPVRIAGLADHAPVYYATLLWNALVRRGWP